MTLGGEDDGNVTLRVWMGHKLGRILDEDFVDANQFARNHSLKSKQL